MTMSEPDYEQPQRDAQRLLGRCMLRLQQYEGLLKALLAHLELAGPARELGALQAARIEEFATDSLGSLAKTLFESYVVVDGAKQPVLDETLMPPDSVVFGFRVNLEMSKERYAQAKASIRELVGLRNDLVHHLIDRFDLWSEEGCIAVSQHLTQSYARIDERYEELIRWARQIDETRQAAATFVQSEAFRNLIVNGEAPEGSVDWPHADVVQVLIEAADLLAVDGWTPLDDAVAWIAERYPEQVPAKYGYRSWPQVLHESRHYELVYRQVGTGGKRPWYRPRPDRNRPHK